MPAWAFAGRRADPDRLGPHGPKKERFMVNGPFAVLRGAARRPGFGFPGRWPPKLAKAKEMLRCDRISDQFLTSN
jgi:hypothetical protein